VAVAHAGFVDAVPQLLASAGGIASRAHFAHELANKVSRSLQ